MTKLAALRAAWEAGDRIGALRIAAKFPRLDAEANVIRRGWDALQHPEIYRQMGRDPDALMAAAMAALIVRYGLPS